MATASTNTKAKVRGGGSGVGDEIARLLVVTVSLCLLALTIVLVFQLWTKSGPARGKFGFEFLTKQIWDPVAEDFGALPFIYGTLVTAFLALMISVPLGVGAAVYLSELATPRISNAMTFLVELLAAVPSVIYGLLAIFTLVPLMRSTIEPALKKALGFTPLFSGPAFGTGYLTAAIVLAVMTFPFIISVSREALLAVPREQREAALALGATRWEATWQVVIPFARLGILGAILLGLARALGETMAVTMVIGNDPHIKASLLAPGYTIAAVIANEFAEATGNMYPAALMELGLVLFVMTILLNGAARLLIMLTTRKGARR